MNDNVFPVEKIKERIVYLKKNKPILGKIKSLTHCISDFLKTEKGKKFLSDFIQENNCYDQKLLKELKTFKNE